MRCLLFAPLLLVISALSVAPALAEETDSPADAEDEAPAADPGPTAPAEDPAPAPAEDPAPDPDPAPAPAEDPAPAPDLELDLDAPADDLLREAWRRDRPRSIAWYASWVAIQGALTAGQLGLALERGPLFASPQGSEDWNYQGQMVVGAATAALGLGTTAAFPPTTMRGAPEDSDELRRLMAAAAVEERQARNWFAHLSVVVVNGAAAALVGTVFDSPHDAIITFLAGVAIGEAQILTRPLAAKRAWRNVQGRFPAEFAVAPWGPGAMVAGRW